MQISSSGPVNYAVLEHYIRNMDNQVLISQHQINVFYPLLLLNQQFPWDDIVHSGPEMSSSIDRLIEMRSDAVDLQLKQWFEVFDERGRNNNLAAMAKLTEILACRHKSIKVSKIAGNSLYYTEQQPENFHDEVMEVFSGVAALSTMTINKKWKYVEYSFAQKSITFKIGLSYLLTVKSEEPIPVDTSSKMSKIPRQLLTNHVFRYLTAEEVFSIRGVCKQWKELVRQIWVFCFKRQMKSHLMLSQFCKDIEYYYKIVQLRNLVYQKLTLLIHAIVELIDWPLIESLSSSEDTSIAMKRVLILLLKLIGQSEPVDIQTMNDLNELAWQQLKVKISDIGDRVRKFLQDHNLSVMSIKKLKQLKINIIDNPFMRLEEVGTEDKTPLLTSLLTKQLTLQSILKSHIMLTQEYLVGARKKLDEVYGKMERNKGFLEQAYKIVLSHENDLNMETIYEEKRSFNVTDFAKSLVRSMMSEQSGPDYTVVTRNNKTDIYIDGPTKLDFIVSTYKKANCLKIPEPK